MALEVIDGEVARWVEAYAAHLVSTSSGEFRSHNAPGPGTEHIESAVRTSEAEILSWIAEAGYSTDTTTYPDLALNYLSFYNAVGAAYRLELMHPGLGFGNNPNSRWREFYSILMDFKNRILGSEGIAGIGLNVVAALRARYSARTFSEKETDEGNADVVKPLFRRGQFGHPEIGNSESG